MFIEIYGKMILFMVRRIRDVVEEESLTIISHRRLWRSESFFFGGSHKKYGNFAHISLNFHRNFRLHGKSMKKVVARRQTSFESYVINEGLWRTFFNHFCSFVDKFQREFFNKLLKAHKMSFKELLLYCWKNRFLNFTWYFFFELTFNLRINPDEHLAKKFLQSATLHDVETRKSFSNYDAFDLRKIPGSFWAPNHFLCDVLNSPLGSKSTS